MITTYMSQKEILTEFWKDYVEVISPRMFREAARHRKALEKRGKEWLRFKEPRVVKASGNTYNIWLSVSYQPKGKTAIKTSVWLSFLDSKTGVKETILLPAEKNQFTVISFTSGFFSEWAKQTEILGSDVLAEFFKWANGNYQVYHSGTDHKKIEIDINGEGAGLGVFTEPGEYKFRHFLGPEEMVRMRKELGKEIMDPLELWDTYNTKPAIIIPDTETEDYWATERQKALDEIYEKYG